MVIETTNWCLRRRFFTMENTTFIGLSVTHLLKCWFSIAKCEFLLGLHGSNMSHGLDRLCPTMLPEAKWIGEKSADGRTYYRSRKSYSGKTLCAENGLGIPQFQTALGGLVLDIFEVNWGFLAAMMFYFSRKSVRVLKEWVSLTVKIWYMNILDINWLVVWNMNFIFPMYIYIYWECHSHNPNWRTDIFQRGRYTTNQFWPWVFHDIRHNLSWASAKDLRLSNLASQKNADIKKLQLQIPTIHITLTAG